MSESNKQVVRRVYGAIAQRDFDALADLISDDVVEHDEFPGLEPTKEGVLRFFRSLTSSFPDMTMTANGIIAEGDTVAVRGTLVGTHEGQFLEIPATGNSVEVPFADFFRIEDGKIAEHWGVEDTGVLMEQLGQG